MTRSLTIIIIMVMTFNVASTANSAVKVTQASFVSFKKNDDTIALAVEDFGKPLRLMVLGKDRKAIYSTTYSEDSPTLDEFSFVNPFLRFKTLNVKGIASPIILTVAAFPGGSDIGYEVKLIAESRREIVCLNPAPINLSIQDGIYLGYINRKYGYGMITWEFQWDAAHYAPHKYKITIYRWDKKLEKFDIKKTFVTRKRFETGKNALIHNGLPSRNFRDEVIKPEQEMSTLGIEAEFLSFTETGKKSDHNKADAPDPESVR